MVNSLVYKSELLKIAMLTSAGQMVSPGAKAAAKVTTSFQRAARPQLAKIPTPKTPKIGNMRPSNTNNLIQQQATNPMTMQARTMSRSMGRGISTGG